jgi:hypothetical protein
MGINMKRVIRSGKVLPALLGAVLLGATGLGVAAAMAQPPVEVTAALPAPPPFEDGSVFPKNASGQTYGVPTNVNGKVAEPDLIRAYATNGRVGYVKTSERKVATGDPSLFGSPEEALRWQENRGNGPVSVAVYDLEGVTEIGEFVFTVGTVSGPVK